MDLSTLQKRFASKAISFDDDHGLVRIHVRTPHATATLYLQGAHLAAWQPKGSDPVIFLSRKSDVAPGKPIRGGVPIVFPWFATDSKKDRINGHPGPSHGFARIQDWSLDSIHQSANSVDLTFTLGPTTISRSMGYDHFRLQLIFRIGNTLTMQMTVTNSGATPLIFEEAFHTYYQVTDIHEINVSGLQSTGYIDKTDDMKPHPPAQTPITFTGPVDRVYNNTTATCVIEDIAGRRRITVSKSGSNTTVVWNPGKELPDLGPWDWHNMVAVETANAGINAITLAPGHSHTMQAHVTVEPILGLGAIKPAERSPRDTA